MKVKTSELTGTALDWTVAKCEGWKYDDHKKIKEFLMQQLSSSKHCYSSVWAKGGPIIEREKNDLFTEKHTPESWVASIPRYQGGKRLVGWRIHQYGLTPLIAAMRCYVASKLGDEVDVPDNLV